MIKKITAAGIALFIFSAVLGGFVLLSVREADAQTAASSSAAAAATMTRDQLQAQIDAKNKQLQDINTQLVSTTGNLKVIQQQKTTLQNQIAVMNGNIKSLNLSIQADTLTTQQLQLQIQQLGGNIQDINSSINTKQAAIQSILQELEQNDNASGNLLVVFLKQNSLADGVFEAQNLHNLQDQLAGDINNLKDLHQQYDDQITQSTAKKNQVVAQQVDLQNKASIVADQQAQKQTLLVSTKGQESVYQKQLTALQQQQESINSEMEAIQAILRTKIDPSTLPPLGAGVLLMPVQGDTQKDITQGYGATAFALTEYVHKWHNGLDLAASIGTPLLAAADGTIAAQGNEDLYCPKGAYGKFVVINHNNGLTTLYGHLSKILVTAGQKVTRGQIIGYSGNTGDVTGPHLHFTVFAQSTYYLQNSKSCGPLPEGGDLDPSGYLF